MQIAPAASTAPALALPAQLGAELAAARAGGSAHARTWTSQHPTGPIDGLLDELYAALPTPPTGAAQQAELAHTLQVGRDASRETRESGLWYGRFGQAGGSRPSMWKDLFEQWRAHEVDRLGPVDGAARAEQGARLLTDALRAANVVIWRSKPLAKEPRPYVLDPASRPPLGGWQKGDYESHPSGHAGTAAAAATVLGALWPERRAELDELADRVSFSRVLGQMHFPHDVVAGTRIGVAAATAVLLRDAVLGAALAA